MNADGILAVMDLANDKLNNKNVFFPDLIKARAAVAEMAGEVERLKEQFDYYQKLHTKEHETALRRVEELNRIVGGQYIFFKERYGVGDKTTKALSQLLDQMEKAT